MKNKTETERLAYNAYMREWHKKKLANMSLLERKEFNAKRYESQRGKPYLVKKVKAYQRRLREAVVSAYGGVCVCCGENEFVFLTIDHVVPIRRSNRSGSESSYSLCLKLKKQGYPAGYQVLCYNCNHAKGTENECPHRSLLVNRILKFRTNTNRVA